jgi:sugar lactone lactonase YvrE
MRVVRLMIVLAMVAGFAVAEGWNQSASAQRPTATVTDDIPIYEWDPTFPKWFPKDWVLGCVCGVVVDAKDHIWVAHHTREGATKACCPAAPGVLELDQAGNLVQAWGGPRAEEYPNADRGGPPPVLTWTPPDFDWPNTEHNLFVDYKDHVWLGNYGGSHIVKLTRQGKFVMKIGRVKARGQTSNDTDALASPTGITVDPKTNEVYVADGYGNRRVIVFDADTGAYKRHWGAYGNKPDDTPPFSYAPGGPPPQQFAVVHCVQIDKDDLVWVCDRGNHRIQVFKKDGSFVKEGYVAPPAPGTKLPILTTLLNGKGGYTVPMPQGTVNDLAFSRDPEQRFVFVADGYNDKVHILRRSDLKEIGSLGRYGHWAGAGFLLPHNVALDSKNNLYVTENTGRRIQRFLYKGVRRAATK